MYPNSPNIRLKLLTLNQIQNSIGTSSFQLHSSKEVIGINFSITSNEYYESKRTDIKIDLALKIQSFLFNHSQYADIDGSIYKIERTYQVGQFIELYLSKTNIRKSDIIGYA
jgi:(p)ppGpp synthase/HD superfamily hydrolase